MSALLETNLPSKLFHRGKVRDTYEFGDRLLMVATDRISAFDVVLPCGIPGKGIILNRLSAFWLEKTAHLVPNHLIEAVESPSQIEAMLSEEICQQYFPLLQGRTMIIKKTKPTPIEYVVRGYLAGSAWNDYCQTGKVQGIPLPLGLKEADKLPQPIFTPTTKAETGHDQPLSFEELKQMVGDDLARELKEKSLKIYSFALEYARTKGIIIADTKLEFGWLDGEVILIDELFTPDSSRFWNVQSYQPGHHQPALDKQLVRDWLIQSGWNQKPPAPILPPEIIERTAEIYKEVYQRLTGS
jgi:phosphoribosylaminoimidazole-succinocarboxamide synthase